MNYRVRVDAPFNDLPPTDWLRRIRDYFLANAHTINPSQPHEEIGFVSLEKCYHDEDPSKPCDVIEEHYTS